MNCLQELLLVVPCRKSRNRTNNDSGSNSSSCGSEDLKKDNPVFTSRRPPTINPKPPKQNQQRQQRRRSRNLIGSSLIGSSTTTTPDFNSEELCRAFFDLEVDEDDNETAESPATFDSSVDVDIKLGNVRKKEIQSSGITSAKSAYVSNHVVVNQERQQRNLPLLTRCAILDEMAKGKAQAMADAQQTLQPYISETMVENVHETPASLQLLHQLIMHGADPNNTARQHILDPRFVKFGMGTARAANGMTYVSQLFQGAPVAILEGEEEEPVVQQQSKPAATDKTDATTNTSTTIKKNPRSRIIPTLDIPVDPAILQGKEKKLQREQQQQQKQQTTTSSCAKDDKKKRKTKAKQGKHEQGNNNNSSSNKASRRRSLEI